MAFINRLNSRHKIQLQWMCILFACPASIFSFSLKRVPRFCFGKHPSPHSSYKALAGLTPLSGFSFGQVTETWSMRVHNWEQFKGSIHDQVNQCQGASDGAPASFTGSTGKQGFPCERCKKPIATGARLLLLRESQTESEVNTKGNFKF